MAVGIIRAAQKTEPARKEVTQPVAEENSTEFFSAAQKVQEESGGKVLGITMFPKEGGVSYGMVAQYAEESTQEDPVILVISNDGGKTERYCIHVNDVNPESATQLEMFAFLSYADDQGLTNAGSFGSYHYLKIYAENAEENGYVLQVSGYGNFLQAKHNWSDIIGRIKGDYSAARLYGQVKNCESLLSTMQAVSGKKTVLQTSAEAVLKTRKGESAGRKEQIAFIRTYIEEQLEKWKKGEIKELSFQIGASLFTEKEWDTLLEKFDAAMKTIREAMKQELERVKEEEQREKERLERETAKETEEEQIERRVEAGLLPELPFSAESNLLLAETLVCTCPPDDPEQPVPRFIICYTEDGMTCKGAGAASGTGWSISFEGAGQYYKVVRFLKGFSEDENLSFAAQKEFWEDFLA